MDVMPPRDNSLVLIGGIGTPQTIGKITSLEMFSKRQSTSPNLSRNTQTFDASVDRKLANDGDYTSIFRNMMVVNCPTVPAPTSIHAVG